MIGHPTRSEIQSMPLRIYLSIFDWPELKPGGPACPVPEREMKTSHPMLKHLDKQPQNGNSKDA